MKVNKLLNKKLLATTVMTAVFFAHLEDVGARLNANVSALLRETNDSPPIIDAYNAVPGAAQLSICNRDLANILATAVFRPIAYIASGSLNPVPHQVRAAALAFVATAPAPGGAVGGAAVPAPLNFAAVRTAIGLIAPGPVVLNVANIQQAAINNAKAAAARLIVASAKATNAAIANNGGNAVPGLNAAAIRAKATVDAVNAAVLGNVYAQPAQNADDILAAFLAVPGAINVVAAAGPIPAPAVNAGPALNLWEHLLERGHLWQIPANLLAAQGAALGPAIANANQNIDANYIIWNRAARVRTGAVPVPNLIHTSFVVPGGGAFAAQFATIFTAANLTAGAAMGNSDLLHVSWNNTLDGMPPPANHPFLAGNGVNVHLNIGAAGGPIAGPAGNVIKADLTGNPLNATITPIGGGGNTQAIPLVTLHGAAAPVANGFVAGQHNTNIRNEFFGTLQEVAATHAVLVANPGAIAALFNPLLGGVVAAHASAPQPIGTVSISVAPNGDMSTMFPE